MSSLRNCFFWAVLSVAVVACQSTRPQTIQETLNLPKTVYRLAELDKNPAALDAVFQHIMRGQTVVLKIDKGYTPLLQKSEASILRVSKGEAVVDYCDPLIARRMDASGFPAG